MSPVPSIGAEATHNQCIHWPAGSVQSRVGVPGPTHRRDYHNITPCKLWRYSAYLLRQLSRVCDDDCRHDAILGLQLVQHREDEHRGLPHSGLGLTKNILALERGGDALLLNCTTREPLLASSRSS